MDYQKSLIIRGIKSLMEMRGWTKADLARVCNIAKQSVNSYLSGKLNPENLLYSLYEAGEDIEWIKNGGSGTSKVNDKPNLEGVSIWESRVSHITEEEKKQLDKLIEELLKESKEDRQIAIEAARIVMKKGKKKKEK